MKSEKEAEKQFFAGLYESSARLMYSRALYYTGDLETAQDVVQEAMEKLLGHYDTLSRLTDKALKSYIVYTVDRICINNKKHQQVEEKHQDELTEMEGPSAEDILLQSIEVDQLKQALKRLPRSDFSLLMRVYLDGEELRDIAKSEGVSYVAIRMRLSRARRRALTLVEDLRKETADET